MDTLSAILISMIAASTPLLFAALGELVTEKSGVLNLGVEGMMLVGAVVAFMVGIGILFRKNGIANHPIVETSLCDP